MTAFPGGPWADRGVAMDWLMASRAGRLEGLRCTPGVPLPWMPVGMQMPRGPGAEAPLPPRPAASGCSSAVNPYIRPHTAARIEICNVDPACGRKPPFLPRNPQFPRDCGWRLPDGRPRIARRAVSARADREPSVPAPATPGPMRTAKRHCCRSGVDSVRLQQRVVVSREWGRQRAEE